MVEFEWGIKTLVEDDGVQSWLYTPRDSAADARRSLERSRLNYPWPDEIQLVRRSVGPWEDMS